MAANRFATILHRNTNRMAVVLVYTFLEWALIALLLLNALFSYLIARFAGFFGLDPPCVFCSRVDRLFEPPRGGGGGGGGADDYRGILCDGHAAEVSRLGFCARHRRLADAGDVCEDCSADAARLSWMRRSEAGEQDLRCSCCGVPLESGFYSPFLLVKGALDCPPVDGSAAGRENPDQNAIFEPEDEVGEKNLLVLVLDPEQEEEEEEEEEEEPCLIEFPGESSPLADDSSPELMMTMIRCEENAIDADRLVAVEVIDEMTLRENHVMFKTGGGADDREMDYDGAERDTGALDIGVVLEEKIVLDSSVERAGSFEASSLVPPVGETIVPCSTARESVVPPSMPTSVEEGAEFKVGALAAEEEIVEPLDGVELKAEASTAEEEIHEPQDSVESKEGASFADEKIDELQNGVEFREEASAAEEEIVEQQDCVEFKKEAPPEAEEEIDEPQNGVEFKKEASAAEEEIAEPQNSDEFKEEPSAAAGEEIAEPQAFEEDTKVEDIDANCEISIGSEICDEEEVEKVQYQEPITPAFGAEDRSSEANNETTGIDQAIETELVLPNLDLLSPELPDVEEERMPESSAYNESIHGLHKRFLFERKESGVESLDGSVASDTEGTEPLTIDSLKSTLKAERKALSALYAELEEERNAAAVAANQTMAMITRLQEEKAAMQMEASHYQRMMDEQSEYDQEALHVLNELLTKREKEKQELEREFEVYRQRVLHYEGKERRKLARRKADGTNGASTPSSSGEESDDFSFDYLGRNESSYSVNEENQNTPIDAVLGFPRDIESTKLLIKRNASVADFDEEKLSILERLKVLEDRLFELEDDESCEINPLQSNDEDYESLSDVLHGSANGYSDSLGNNGKLLHSEGTKTNTNTSGKRLLPLFDAVSVENEDALASKEEEAHEAGNLPKLASKIAKVQERLAFGEEVDDVYERLQALEADREFLKHCVKSLKKGDKGMDLLKEILHHLRELRSVELRGRNATD